MLFAIGAVDITKKLKIQKNMKAMVGAQVLTQKIEGLNGTPTLLGAKAGLAYKNIQLTLAYNKSNGEQVNLMDYWEKIKHKTIQVWL